MFCLPFINILGLFMYFLIKFTKIKSSFIEELRINKHPELASFDSLLEIRKYYMSDDKLKCDVESCNNKYCNNEKHWTSSKKPVIYLKEFKRNLSEVLEFLENNHNKSNVPHILLTYELTFTKILSILKESKKVNNRTTDEVLVAAKKSIDFFISEIQQVIKALNEIEVETEVVINKRYIDELEMDTNYHQERNTIKT
jgi:hypothetical protein